MQTKAQIMLHTKGLQVGYNSHPVLTIPQLEFSKGSCIALQGVNGSGKSTFLKTITGLLKPVAGSLVIQSQKISYVPQREPASMRIPMDVRQYIRLGFCAPWLDAKSKITSQLDYILGALLLTDCQHTRIGQCSAGQFQRALFARAWLALPELIILDEPTSSLDDQVCEAVRLQIQSMLNDKCTIILATHDERLLGKHISQTYIAQAGRLVQK